MQDKVNIAVVGCGYWGPNLVRNFSALPNCYVSKVCDKNTYRLEYIKKEFPFVLPVQDYRDVLDDNSIDAVCIATPVMTHAKLAIDAMNAGKHVFIEKPMASSLEEAERIIRASEKNNRKVAIGHVFQFAPAVRKIKELISQSVIGDLYHITSSRINLGPPKTDVNVLWDLGPHDFSIILDILGEFPKEIKAVNNSYEFGIFNSNTNKIINNSHISLFFQSGITSHIHLSWLSSVKVRLMHFFGSEGTIIYDEMLALDGKVKIVGKGIDNRINVSEKKLAYSTGDIHIVKLEQHEPLRKECEHFIDSILYSKEIINNAYAGLNVIKLLSICDK